MESDGRSGGFGLYVHWPYCQAKCPYCDFNSHVAREIDETAWVAAYVAEIRRVARDTPGRVLDSIFFGGGTPSLMTPETVDAVIGTARACWPASNNIEITLEANPGSVEAARFARYRDAGVNRISIGVQSLNDPDLRRLGRLHTAAEAIQAIDIAKECFDRVSFDLIYARQDQTPDAWVRELEQALDLAVDHLSLYQLTIEPGTMFGARHEAGQLTGLPDDDRAADMYHLTQAICQDHNMPAYEVSNHAGPGAESRHNLIYWRCGDYAGIGPGAHGRLTLGGQRVATECPRQPAQWLQAVKKGSGQLPSVILSPQDVASEYLIMGMRLSEGLDIDRYCNMIDGSLDAATVSHLTDLGLVETTDRRLCATTAGRAVLNAIIRDLSPG